MKAFYREWGRCWLLITWGRYPEPLADQYAADDVPHPYSDPDALQGHVTAPAGAQDFQVVYDEAGGESGWSGQTKNWVDQSRDGS